MGGHVEAFMSLKHGGEGLDQALQLGVAHGRREAAEAGDRDEDAVLQESADELLEGMRSVLSFATP